MSVFIDDADIPYYSFRLNRTLLMSHMIADTPEELMAMAAKIGVAAKWLQHPGTPREHFDVCKTLKAKAIEAGAIQVTAMELARIIRDKNEEALRG